ncbi:MAG TPA: DNA primase [Cyclobacteriaceae bacterium]
MISRNSIDDVKSRLDIVDVISDFISLKRSGQNYKALSPFTNEKTASFYVVPSKGIFKDFSSGKGGDAITFVMEHEGMSYMEAIKFLAKKYGVEIKEDASLEKDQAAQSERDGLYIVMNYAKEYFKEMLFKNDEGKSIGLSYFRERGFNDRNIEKFELGYALNEWHGLEKLALKSGYSQQALEKSGLIIKKEDGKTYDRFRGRVIFPVHNLSGKVVAFGARILTKEKDQPKYINSPETEIYHKSNVLYGMYQAKNEIRKHDFCYLVEGYTDVMSLHQAGIENVVASSGTALTEEQIKLMRRFTENVTVLFDGDAAGIKAALRGIDLVLKGGLNVRIVLLPDGDDPDSFSKKMGTTALIQYLKDHTKDFISFKIELYSADAAKDPIKKAELIRDIVTSITAIPDPLKRTVYLQECSKKLEVPLSILSIEVKKILLGNKAAEAKSERIRGAEDSLSSSLADVHTLSKSFLLSAEESLALFEKEFIKVLINQGHLKTADEEFGYEYLFRESQDVDFINPLHQEIIDHYKVEVAKGQSMRPDTFLRSLSQTAASYVSEFLVQKYFISEGWKKHHILIGDEYVLEQSSHKVIMQLKLGIILKMLNDNLQKIKETTTKKEQDELLEIQATIDGYKNTIASSLGRIVLPNMKLLQDQ